MIICNGIKCAHEKVYGLVIAMVKPISLQHKSDKKACSENKFTIIIAGYEIKYSIFNSESR